MVSKNLFYSIGRIFLFLITSLFFVGTIQAEYGLQETANSAKLNQYGTDVSQIVGSIVGTALSIVSVIFFILMIYAGFLWMTAHGKEDQEKKARNTIFAAIIGIIIVLAAYAITNLVFNSVKPGNVQAPPKGVDKVCYDTADNECVSVPDCGANQLETTDMSNCTAIHTCVLTGKSATSCQLNPNQ